jgi:hypothetical protein
MRRPLSALQALVAALALAGAPSNAHGHVYAVTRTAKPEPAPPPTESFEEHQAASMEAMQTGNWDRFLDQSERALRALPESERAHADRAEIMQPVGMWELDARTDAQRHHSIQILELYVEQLRQAYGDAAAQRPGWAPAHQYLDDLRSRLPSTTATPPAAPAVGGAPPPPPSIGPEPRDGGTSPRTTAVIIGGATATGVGGVLTITGLALIEPWVTRAADHDDLKREHQVCNCVTKEQHDASWSEYTRARGSSLGLMVTGAVLASTGAVVLALGLRKRKQQQQAERLSVAPGGFYLRF